MDGDSDEGMVMMLVLAWLWLQCLYMRHKYVWAALGLASDGLRPLHQAPQPLGQSTKFLKNLV